FLESDGEGAVGHLLDGHRPPAGVPCTHWIDRPAAERSRRAQQRGARRKPKPDHAQSSEREPHGEASATEVNCPSTTSWPPASRGRISGRSRPQPRSSPVYGGGGPRSGGGGGKS